MTVSPKVCSVMWMFYVDINKRIINFLLLKKKKFDLDWPFPN